jgi:hypothetical protein
VEDGYPVDYCSPKAFREQLPTLHPSMHSLQWELRSPNRERLIEDGVVIERWTEGASRPSILISPSRYVARLRRQSRRGVAA